MNHIKYALRVLLKSPGFTTVALLTLALGIGVNTAMFTLVDSVLLRPLPYPDPTRLVAIDNVFSTQTGREAFRIWSYPRFDDLRRFENVRRATASFSDIAGYATSAANLTGDGNPERVEVELVSASYFRVLRVDAARGRTFLDEEDAIPGARPVAVISDALWKRRYGADPGISGRVLRLNGVALTVVGVMPENFRDLAPATGVWVPMMMAPALSQIPNRLTNARAYWMRAVGRLADGVTLAQAAAAVRVIDPEIEKAHPGPSSMRASIDVRSLLATKVDPALQKSLLVLFGAVGFVLLIACANLANLLLSRNEMRRHEAAIRIALGATRGALVRQFLTENLLLAIAGGALGLLVAHWGVELAASLRPEAVHGFWATYARSIDPDAARLNLWVIAFNLGASLLTGLAFGVMPALEVSRMSVSARAHTLRRADFRSVLIVAEVALALALLAGAGLMLGSFSRLIHVPTGFAPDHVATAHIELPRGRYKPDQVVQFMEQLLAKISAEAGANQSALANSLPLSGQAESTVAGLESEEPAHAVGVHVVSPEFFGAMRIPLLQGRLLTPADREGSPGVVLINEAAAQALYPGENAIGKRINLATGGSGGPLKEIVGVVGDVKYESMESRVGPDVYVSYLQYPYELTYILVRTPGDPASMVPAIRRAVADLDRDLPVTSVMPMQARFDAASSRIRFVAELLGLFAAMALLLAAIGIYGVVSYSVSARTREIGIRMALGARAGVVLRDVTFDGLRLAALGVALGVPLALWSTRVLASMLYEVKPGDPKILAAVSALLIFIAFAASYLPARRAAKVDPMVALRHE